MFNMVLMKSNLSGTTHMHSYTHTYTMSRIHTYPHPHLHTYIHTPIHICQWNYIPHTYTHIRTNIHRDMHTYSTYIMYNDIFTLEWINELQTWTNTITFTYAVTMNMHTTQAVLVPFLHLQLAFHVPHPLFVLPIICHSIHDQHIVCIFYRSTVQLIFIFFFIFLGFIDCVCWLYTNINYTSFYTFHNLFFDHIACYLL